MPLSWGLFGFVALRCYAEECAFSLGTQAQDHDWDLAEYKLVEPAHCPTGATSGRTGCERNILLGIPPPFFLRAPYSLHDWGVRTLLGKPTGRTRSKIPRFSPRGRRRPGTHPPKKILDRRRDLINDRPNRATAAEAPLDGAQERYHFDNPTTHTHAAHITRVKQHSAFALPCTFCL